MGNMLTVGPSGTCASPHGLSDVSREDTHPVENEIFVNLAGLLSRARRLQNSPALEQWRSRAYRLQNQIADALAAGMDEETSHDFRQRENSLRYELKNHERVFFGGGPSCIDFDAFEYSCTWASAGATPAIAGVAFRPMA